MSEWQPGFSERDGGVGEAHCIGAMAVGLASWYPAWHLQTVCPEEVEVTSATWCSDSPAVSGSVETNTHGDSQRDPLDTHVAARSENDGEIVARFSSEHFRVYDFVSLATGGELERECLYWINSEKSPRQVGHESRACDGISAGATAHPDCWRLAKTPN